MFVAAAIAFFVLTGLNVTAVCMCMSRILMLERRQMALDVRMIVLMRAHPELFEEGP